jgi:hypothetical protein
MNNRVFYKSVSGLQDVSSTLSSYLEKDFTFNYVEGDFLYVGARLPFNHLYFKVNSPNETPRNMKIEFWEGNRWREVVDIIDSTNTFNTSGHIEFTPDKEYQWWRYDTNYSNSKIPELETITVYDKYWLRISFDGNLDEDVSLNFIGNLFSDDLNLKLEYPDLLRSNVLASFEAGKTNWNDQHLRASEILIKDLIDIGVIKEKGQILNWRDYIDTNIHKVAEIIFNSFGDSYVDNTIAARREYQDRLNKRIHRVDRNNDAIESIEDSFNITGFMTR